MSQFDFDHWSALARRDPEGFFRARRAEIERYIAAQPPEAAAKLREMQQRIDCNRAHAGCPMKALACLVGMIQERLRLLRVQSGLLARAAEKLSEEVKALSEPRAAPQAARPPVAPPVVLSAPGIGAASPVRSAARAPGVERRRAQQPPWPHPVDRRKSAAR